MMKLTSFLILFLLAVGCNKSADTTFGDLESSTGNSEIPCGISSTSPSISSLKVAATSGTKTVFNVETTTDSCEITFSINGTKFNTTSSNFIEVDANNLSAGLNTVSVEAVNGSGSATYEWTVTKNVAPTCARELPSDYGVNMTKSTPQNFTVSATKEDDEDLVINWLLDGAADAKLRVVLSGDNGSMSELNANTLSNGIKTVSARISDGYDEVTCSWSVSVGDACSVTAKTPDVESVKLAAAGASSNFGVTLSSSSCIVNWTLNGVSRTGNGPSFSVTSSDLPTILNTLEAKIVTGTTISSKSWEIIKNSPPVCAQTPLGSATTSIGTPLNLQANISDPNGDTVNWTWYFNGTAVTTSSPVNVSNLPTSTSAAFTPTIGNIGYNAFNIALNDGYDSASCLWNVQVNPTCTITSKTPATSTLTVPNSPTTLNPFNVLASDASCAIAWSLIDESTSPSIETPVPGVNAITLMSGLLNGTNKLKVTVSNATSSASHTWTIKKNTPPVCSSQIPPALSQILGVGATQDFTANILDPDAGQTLSYDWKLDGSTPSLAFFSSAPGANSTTGTWTTTSGQIGNHTLAVNVSDTFDSTQCSWPVEVLRNCAVASSTPSGTSLKVAALGSTSTSFGAVANDASCVISWKLKIGENEYPLNESPNGQNFQNILSSALDGNQINVLEAVMVNTVSDLNNPTKRTWNITKNNPPVCFSQNPGSAGNTVNTGSSLGLSLNATDVDSDPLTYSWSFNNSSSSSLIVNPILVGYNSGVTFTPVLAQVGNNNTIKATLNDSYDTSICSWNVSVIDPNSATIIDWTPKTEDSRAVILSNGDKTFSVVALGTGLSYKWYLDIADGDLDIATPLGGRSGSSTTFDFNDMSVGLHTITVVVEDTYGNKANKKFNVKRNAAPSITSFEPNVSGVSLYRVGINHALNFFLTAEDENGDHLTYNWRLDDFSSSYLVGSSNTAVLSPSDNISLLGTHTVKVLVSDGHETAYRSWPVSVNFFSNECNELYNSPTTGVNAGGGKVCTLVGNPSIGHGQDITTDPTVLKSRPFHITEIDNDIYAVSDFNYHLVYVYNDSNTDFIGLGKTILPGTMQVVLGNGANGRNADASPESLGNAFQNVGPIGSQVSMPAFKLNEPRGVAWHEGTQRLYVADRYNHRVLAINSQGKVRRILGLDSGLFTNNASTNTDGADGHTQSCIEPIGLAIYGDYLYVACYGYTNFGAGHQFYGSAIKRVNINDPTLATYGKTDIVVGRPNPLTGGINTHNHFTMAMPDGFSGTSTDLSLANSATAMAYLPLDLNVDNNGVVYWTEGRWNHGHKIRAYNPNNYDYIIAPSGHPGLSSSTGPSSGTSLLFRALDLNWQQTSPSPSVPNNNNGYYVQNPYSVALPEVGTSGVLNNLLVSSHGNMAVNGCHAVSISLRNAGNVSIGLSGNTIITMSATPAFTGFFSDASCATPLVSNQLTIAPGETHKTIFVKPTSVTSPTGTVNASTPLLPTGSASGFSTVTVTNASSNCGTLCKIKAFASPRFKYNECLPVEFQMTNSSNSTGSRNAASDTHFAIDHNNIGQFYSSFNCNAGSRIHRIKFTPTEFNKIVYYRREIIVPAGGVATIAGYAYDWARVAGDYADAKIGEMKFTNELYGIATLNNPDSTAMNPLPPKAIVWTSNIPTNPNANNFVNLINLDNSSSVSYGGRTFQSLRNHVIAGTSTGSFNGDDQVANISTVWGPHGVQVTSNGSKILFADRDNYRVRSIDLNSANEIKTVAGAGRARHRVNVPPQSAQEAALLSPYKVEYYGGYVYFSELNNHQIKRVNLSNGQVQTVVGNGFGTTYTDGNDATAEGLNQPRGFKVIPYGTDNTVLIYAQAGNCLVRAVNISGPDIPSFFGVGALLKGKVKTIAGDSTYNCSTWNLSGNSDGMDATDAKLADPQDVAYIGSDLYIIQSSDHCILKVTSLGKLSRPQGPSSCVTGVGPTPVYDSAITSMKTRNPRAFYPDSANPGNYFYVDDYSNQTGTIRYLNTLTNPIIFGNTSPTIVAAKGPSAADPFMDNKIYQLSVSSGFSNIGGVTSWSDSTPINPLISMAVNRPNDKVCWSAGALSTLSTVGSAPNVIYNFTLAGNSGPHAIYCQNRYLNGQGELTAGPTDISGIRAGSPIGREQEKIDKLNATFFSPYGIAFDDEGNLYVSDYDNHIIRMIRRWW
jgi:hypothetical protein